ncbi:MAG: TIGR00159 family protein [Fretibacterium sp.]|nr:TIGR00159 family protein [Fretibacterium sp.]
MWADVRVCVDIFIVALIIYRILVLMVGTRAIQLLKGVLMLLLFSLVASVMQLRLLSWLLGRGVWALSFVIPILFQPELRKMLEEIGRGYFWRRPMDMEQADDLSKQVAGALAYMKKESIGALLVLQQETGLREYWRTAVQLNAGISQELLLSIFWGNNPLHDGAVIMDRNTLIAAGCYLPLADVPDISRWYGTRHRAALGITEVSDALVLVVSEERGEVSLAFKGHLSKNLKEPQIEKLLLHYFTGSRDSARKTWKERIAQALRIFWSV